MKAEEVNRVAVLGAGVMGHGIAEVASLSGCEVSLYDIKEEFVRAGIEKIKWSVSKFEEKKAVSPEKARETLARVIGTTSLDDAVSKADLVIEAAPEDLGLKRELFSKVDGLAPAKALLASNTSTLPISEIASALSRPSNFVGMHFFNPPPLMSLLEVIRGEKSSSEAVDEATALGRRFGKEVVLCNKDVPGFIVNRVLGPLLNEAAWVVARGEATVPEVDAMAVRVGLPMGPFELADYSGIDTIYRAGVAVSSRDKSNVMVAPQFKQMSEEGKLGRKSGEGFYKYKGGKRERPPPAKEVGESVDPLAVFAPSVNAAAWLLRNGVCTADDLDKSVKLGLGFPDGILRMADKWGVDKIVGVLRGKAKAYGPFYGPDPMLVQMVDSGKAGVNSGRGFYQYGTAAPASEEVIVRIAPPLAWVVLNRPHRLNALTQKMVAELSASLRSLDQDERVRVTVITGEGERAFSVGADLTALASPTPAKVYDLARGWFEAFSTAERVSKPVVAAINGLALGGGCELALACDFRLAVEGAEIGLTETRLGLLPGAGGTQRLARLVGLAKAKEMVFLGERLPASEAQKVGLVNKTFKREDFEEGVKDFAGKLAKQPPLSLKFAKQALNSSTQVPTDLGQLFEAVSFSILSSSDDASEGISAMLGKREPEFKGS